MNLAVGDQMVVPPALKLTATPTLGSPSGVVIPLELSAAADGSAGYRSPNLTEPGVYTLTTGTGPVPVAVNVPAEEEADVHTLDNAAVKSALGGIEMELNDDQPPVTLAVSAMGEDRGWPIMAIVLMLVGAESFMAMRFGHFRKK